MSVSRCERSQEYVKIASNFSLDFRMDLGLQRLIKDGAGHGPGSIAC